MHITTSLCLKFEITPEKKKIEQLRIQLFNIIKFSYVLYRIYTIHTSNGLTSNITQKSLDKEN